jgi:hypothetical protein
MTLVGELGSEPLNESIGKWFTQKRSSLAITITLHILLWGSVIAVVLSVFMLSTPVDSTLLPSAVLIIASVSLLKSYSFEDANHLLVCLHFDLHLAA